MKRLPAPGARRLRRLTVLLVLLIAGIWAFSVSATSFAESNGVRFRPRLDTIPEPAPPAVSIPDSSYGPGPGPGPGTHHPGVPWLSVASLLLGIGSSLALTYLLRRELRSFSGSGGWNAGGGLSIWDRLGLWWETTKGQMSDRWSNTRDWFKYVALPWAGYAAKAAGLYAAGFVFEFTSGLGFGIGHLFLHLIGRSPNDVADTHFQMGRMGGAKGLEYWGYLEILLGVTGKGAGLLASATGVGAVVGVPAIALSAGIVAVGTGHSIRGRIAYRQAEEAQKRTGGRSKIKKPDLSLLSEAEVRKLLGPEATDQAVANFMRFQEYAAEKTVVNFDKGRVAALLHDKDVGKMLAKWVDELGVEGAANLFHKYSQRRALLGSITENRFAQSIIKDGNKILLKVNKHPNLHGADVVYLDLTEKRLVIVEAKGSVSGTRFKPDPRRLLSHAVEETVIQQTMVRETLSEMVKNGSFSQADANLILKRMKASEVSVVLTTGGTASFNSDVIEAIARELNIPVERVRLIPLD